MALHGQQLRAKSWFQHRHQSIGPASAAILDRDDRAIGSTCGGQAHELDSHTSSPAAPEGPIVSGDHRRRAERVVEQEPAVAECLQRWSPD
jgi:hypothetical protein